MNNKVILLKYQENFADNLSAIAYGEILSKNNNKKYYYENNTQNRTIFEKQMHNFNLDFDYISKSGVNRITKEAFLLNDNFLQNKLSKKSAKKDNKNNIVNVKYFSIDDIDLIDEKIKRNYEFKNLDFIINYDILESIQQTNSIGLYINKKDILSNQVDFKFIARAEKRLNKYLKKPMLFIFTDKNLSKNLNLNLQTKHKIITLYDWREEFYFLTNCKHKIILNSPNSYSAGFWASVLTEKSYNLYIYDKTIKTANQRNNWIKG